MAYRLANPYTLTLLLASLLSFGSAAVTLRYRDERTALPLGAFLAAGGLWSFGDALRVAAPTELHVLFWNKVAYVGIVASPVALLLFVAAFTNRERWLERRSVVALVTISLLALVVILTNPWHLLWRQGETFALGTAPPVLVEIRGPIWYLWSVYAYGIVLLSFSYLVRELLERGRSRTYQTQVALVLLGVLVPVVANLLFVLGWIPFDPAPPTFVVMGTVFAVAIVRYRILDITPIARAIVLDSLDSGVVVLDDDDRIVDANPVARRVLDLDEGRLPGDDLASSLAHEPGLVEAFEDVRETSETVSVDADGGVRHYTVEISPIEDPLGGSFGRVVVFTDVTDGVDRKRRLRERTEELRQQNERLDEFASIVSHDLRTPLEVARGGLQLGRDTGDEEHFDRTEEGLDRMERLIDELLVLARQGRAIEEPTPVDLGSVAAVSWSSLQTGAATLDNRLGDLTVPADESRLGHAFENLFRNALEHNDGDVNVVVGPLEDREGFFVADDGRGIPEDQRETVFDRGYTIDEGGTGLGLAIVAGVVDAHGWDLRLVESRWGGARFEVLTDPPDDRAEPAAPESVT